MSEWEPLVKLLELLSNNPAMKAWVQLVSLLVICVGLYRYLIKPSWRFHWKLYDAVDKAIKSFPVIMRMAEDFRPNGGTSLRDAVNRIEMRQNFLKSRMMALLNTTTGPLFEATVDGKWCWVNRAFCDVTGYLPEQVFGYGWLNLICQDYQVDITAQWNLAIQQKRDTILEFDLVLKNDVVVPVKIETTALRDEGEEVVGYIGRMSVVNPSPASPPALPGPIST